VPAQELAQNLWLQPVTTMEKPYTIEQLLDAVRLILRAADRAPGSSNRGQTDEAGHRSGVRLTFPQPEHMCRG